MGVEVREGQAVRSQRLHLRGELAPHVVGVDPTERAAGEERPPARREVPALVDERRHLPGGEHRALVAHQRQVGADAEPGVPQRGRGVRQRRAVGEGRRAGDDPARAGTQNRLAEARRQAEVVGVHDEERPGHFRGRTYPTGPRGAGLSPAGAGPSGCRSPAHPAPRIFGASARHSARIPWIVPHDDSVETPRERAK